MTTYCETEWRVCAYTLADESAFTLMPRSYVCEANALTAAARYARHPENSNLGFEAVEVKVQYRRKDHDPRS